MAPMRVLGGAGGRRPRALTGVLLAALAAGAVTAAVVAPGADGRPAPARPKTAGRPAVQAMGHGHRHDATTTTSPAAAAPVASVAPARIGFVADPTTEAEVAADIIVAIDKRSDGRFAIVATADNVALLETWMNNEGGLWADNPLNTSLDAARYPHQITSAGQNTGIPVFPNITTGIDATATTLLSGHSYTAILWVLAEGTASCDAFARAVMASPWAASHYGGNPSHFCGNEGGSGTPGAPSKACLRLRGRAGRVNVRMPAACGGKASSSPHGGPAHGRRKASANKTQAPSAPAHRQKARNASGHGAGRAGSARHGR